MYSVVGSVSQLWCSHVDSAFLILASISARKASELYDETFVIQIVVGKFFVYLW